MHIYVYYLNRTRKDALCFLMAAALVCTAMDYVLLNINGFFNAISKTAVIIKHVMDDSYVTNKSHCNWL